MLPTDLLSRYRFDSFAGAFGASRTEAVRQHAEQSEQDAHGPQIRGNSVRDFWRIQGGPASPKAMLEPARPSRR